MRQAVIRTLCELARTDDRIVLLTGDLGYLVMEPFRDAFPDRFINVGVAEQNMIGIATGLAEAGLRPYTYSIATFASLRAFEFIRNGPVAHNLPVRMIGVGAGFGYGHAGTTHYALEDIGALRTLSGLTVVVPADSAQAAAAVRETRDRPGPVYFSLGKDEVPDLPGLDGRFAPGRLQVVAEGQDLLIVTMGPMAGEALAAARLLAAQGLRPAVAVVSAFNPDPEDDMAGLLSRCPAVISVEAQTISGGLAAFVSSVIAARGLPCTLRALAVRGEPDGTSGSPADRWRKHRLDRTAIVEAATSLPGLRRA